MNSDTTKYSSYDEIPLFLDANDIVRILGISKANVYYMFKADGFPTIALGKRKLVRKEKLFSWLEAQECSAPEQCLMLFYKKCSQNAVKTGF